MNLEFKEGQRYLWEWQSVKNSNTRSELIMEIVKSDSLLASAKIVQILFSNDPGDFIGCICPAYNAGKWTYLEGQDKPI